MELHETMRAVADASGIGRRELAKRMGLDSTSTLQRVLEGHNTTTLTLQRFADATGRRLRIDFEPVGETTGREKIERLARDSPILAHALDCHQHRGMPYVEAIEGALLAFAEVNDKLTGLAVAAQHRR